MPGSPVGLWARLAERFGLVALRPRLADDVKIRHVGEDLLLVRLSTDVSFPISSREAELARRFDGTRTVGELVLDQLGREGAIDLQTVSNLIDRCLATNMLADFPPNLFNQLQTHLAGRAVELAHDRAVTPRDALDEADVESQRLTTFEQVPWRPRTPLLADRAAFLRRVPLFADLDSWTIGALAEAAHDETYPAMTTVVKQGTMSDRFYVVRSGELNVQRTEDDGTNHRIAKLGQGDYFGETGLLEMATRNASVRVSPARPAQLLRFELETFERIISPHISQFRGRQLRSQRRTRLESLSIFSQLGPAELEAVAQAVHEHRVPEGTVVIRQGDPGDRFYLVVGGKLSVERDGVVVASLGDGDFFGETALLFTEERTATVRASEDAVVWSIDGAAFRQLLKSHLLGARDVMPTLLNRVAGR